MNTRVSAIMACYNRKETTLASIRALNYAAAHAQIDLSIFILDDVSDDGTAQAIQFEFARTTVVPGTGKLYWNGGMRRAWQTASRAETDFYLWVNDDLVVHEAAIARALALYNLQKSTHTDRVLVCGRVVDPVDGETTYGGLVHRGRCSKTAYRHLKNGEALCDTFTGNFVLLPRRVVEDIGILSDRYTHHWGDLDYGLRARRAGYRIVQTEQPVGEQPLNTAFAERLSYLSFDNWRFILFDPKGVTPREWFHYCRSHSGALWPLRYVWRYVALIISGVRRTIYGPRPPDRHHV